MVSKKKCGRKREKEQRRRLMFTIMELEETIRRDHEMVERLTRYRGGVSVTVGERLRGRPFPTVGYFTVYGVFFRVVGNIML